MPSFLHSVATARLASLWPLSAPSIPSLGAGIRRGRGDPSVPPQALLGLLLAHVQVVQKKHPMKCAGVAGRQVRAGRGGRLGVALRERLCAASPWA